MEILIHILCWFVVVQAQITHRKLQTVYSESTIDDSGKKNLLLAFRDELSKNIHFTETQMSHDSTSLKRVPSYSKTIKIIENKIVSGTPEITKQLMRLFKYASLINNYSLKSHKLLRPEEEKKFAQVDSFITAFFEVISFKQFEPDFSKFLSLEAKDRSVTTTYCYFQRVIRKVTQKGENEYKYSADPFTMPRMLERLKNIYWTNVSVIDPVKVRNFEILIDQIDGYNKALQEYFVDAKAPSGYNINKEYHKHIETTVSNLLVTKEKILMGLQDSDPKFFMARIYLDMIVYRIAVSGLVWSDIILNKCLGVMAIDAMACYVRTLYLITTFEFLDEFALTPIFSISLSNTDSEWMKAVGHFINEVKYDTIFDLVEKDGNTKCEIKKDDITNILRRENIEFVAKKHTLESEGFFKRYKTKISDFFEWTGTSLEKFVWSFHERKNDGISKSSVSDEEKVIDKFLEDKMDDLSTEEEFNTGGCEIARFYKKKIYSLYNKKHLLEEAERIYKKAMVEVTLSFSEAANKYYCILDAIKNFVGDSALIKPVEYYNGKVMDYTDVAEIVKKYQTTADFKKKLTRVDSYLILKKSQSRTDDEEDEQTALLKLFESFNTPDSVELELDDIIYNVLKYGLYTLAAVVFVLVIVKVYKNNDSEDTCEDKDKVPIQKRKIRML